MSYRDKLGSVHEAMVDMNKIRRAREFMNRDMTCPVYNTPRKYNRIYTSIPFHNTNMADLSQALQDPSKPSLPKGLRTLNPSEVHKRANEVI